MCKSNKCDYNEKKTYCVNSDLIIKLKSEKRLYVFIHKNYE